MLRESLAVALGGMLGCLARYGLASLFALIGSAWLPIGTLVANVLGCFTIGALAHWSLQQDLSHHWWVLGVRVGLLGGLTTFSSFALEVVQLWRTGREGIAVGLGVLHVALGLVAVAGGIWLAAHWMSDR